MNMDRVIVSLREGEVPKVFDFLKDGEADEQAEERAFLRAWIISTHMPITTSIFPGLCQMERNIG